MTTPSPGHGADAADGPQDGTAATGPDPVTDFDPFRFGRPEPGSPAAAAFPHLFPPQPDAGPVYPPPGTGLGYPPPGYPPPGYPPAGHAPTGHAPTGDAAPWYAPPGYPPPGGPTYPTPGAGLGYPPPQPGTGLGPPGYPAGYVNASGYGPSAVGKDGRPGNGKAVAGLVLGIASVVLFFFTFFDIIPIVLAYVFSIQGLQAAKRGKGQRGLAVAGIVLASVAVVILIAVVAYFAVRINHCQQHHDQGTKAYNQCLINF